MREILFRGKSFLGDWDEGHFYEDQQFIDGVSCVDVSIIVTEDFEMVRVKPETVGQFTGLTDKNGAKVFEGDLVKYFIHTYKVGFHNGTFGLFSIEHVGFTPFFDSINMSCEIIGNIHEGDK